MDDKNFTNNTEEYRRWMLNPPIFHEYNKYGTICDDNVNEIINILQKFHLSETIKKAIQTLIGIVSVISTMSEIYGLPINQANLAVAMARGLSRFGIYYGSLILMDTFPTAGDSQITRTFKDYIKCVNYIYT